MSELITDAMVEAAARTEWTHERHIRPWEKAPDGLADHCRGCSRNALEAAAPAIAAKALQSLADDMDATGWGHVDDWAVPVVYSGAIRARADRIEHDARCPHPKCPGHGMCCCPEVKP